MASHPHDALSARQIARLAADRGVSISAVYRNLSDMEAAGLLRKVAKAGSREAFYRYTGREECREHIHLSCKKCGKTVHLDQKAAEPLLRGASEKEGFLVDCASSVLVGLCGACRKQGAV